MINPSDSSAWQPLAGSAQQVVVELLKRGPAARADLARRLGLSSGSLTRLTKPLLERGLLVEGEAIVPHASGRPGMPLQVCGDAAHFIGIKLVAGRAFSVVTDLHGTVLRRAEFTLDTGDPGATITGLARAIQRTVAKDPGIVAAGISLGARVLDRSVVVDSALLGWQQVELAAELTERTGLPSWVENDVNALTQAESWFGAARLMDDFVLITMGIGIGGGIVTGGRQLTGTDGTAATISHLELDPHGPICSSGHTGCAVTTITSGAIAARASQVAGTELSFAQTMSSPDPAVQQVVAHAARLVGKLAGMLATVLAPEQILLTGDGIAVARRHRDQVQAGFTAALPGRGSATSVKIVPFDFSEWARGAAVVAVQMYVTTES